MLQHQGRPAVRLTDAALAGFFEKQLATAREWLVQQPNVHVLYLNYRDVIGHPLVVAGQINHFHNGNLRVADMAAAINESLYRQRKSAPVNPA